jgi:hypothetical protein
LQVRQIFINKIVGCLHETCYNLPWATEIQAYLNIFFLITKKNGLSISTMWTKMGGRKRFSAATGLI